MLGSNPNETLLSSAGGHLMRHLRAYLKLGSSSVPSNFLAPVEPRQEKVEFTGTYSSKPPLVSPRPDVDKQVKPSEHVSAMVSGASADTVWCFLRDKPEAVVLARNVDAAESGAARRALSRLPRRGPGRAHAARARPARRADPAGQGRQGRARLAHRPASHPPGRVPFHPARLLRRGRAALVPRPRRNQSSPPPASPPTG